MNTVKNIVILALFIALCAALLYACNEQTNRRKAEKKAAENEIVLDAVVKPVKEYKDKSGANHQTFKNSDSSENKRSLLKHFAPFVDSVAKALNSTNGEEAKSKDITSVLVIQNQTLADQVAFLQRKIDSLNRSSYYYKDKYLELAVRSGDPADTSDKGTFDFKYNAELTIVQYAKRRKFFGIGLGARQSFTDISSNDPRTTIMGVKRYTVVQQQPSWGLRIQATQNYSFISRTANTGIGARFDLKHMSLYGAYYYNWDFHAWRPVISLSYDLLRF